MPTDVTVDARTDGFKTSGATSLAWNHTIAPGLVNPWLLVMATSATGTAVNPTSVKWDTAGVNQTVPIQTSKADGFNNCMATIAGVSPGSSGTKQVKVTYAASVEIIGGSASYQYVKQSGTYDTATTGTSGTTGTTSTLNVNSSLHGMAVSCLVENDGSTLTLGASQTQIHNENIGSVNSASISSDKAGASGTVAMTVNGIITGNGWGHAGVSLIFDGTSSAVQAPMLATAIRPVGKGRIGPLAMVMRGMRAPSLGGAPQTFTLPVSTGVFTITGQTVALDMSHRLPLANGTFAISGQDVALKRAFVLPVGQGSYALTGQNVNLAASRRIPLVAASYGITGQTVRLLVAHRLPLTNATFTLSGQTVRLLRTFRIALANGVYAINGQDVTLTHTSSGAIKTLGVGTGLFALTGEAVSLRAMRRLAIAAGIFTLTGKDVRTAVVQLDDTGDLLPSRGIRERRFGAIRTRNRPASLLIDRGPTSTSTTTSGDVWTPADLSGAGLTLDVIAEACRVVRQSGFVHAFFAIVLPVTASAAPATIGLPVIARETVVPVAPVVFSYTTIADVTGIVVNGASQFNLYHTDGTPVTNAQLSGKVLRGCAIYEAAQ